MFGIGPLELVAILVVALLIFGPAKLPELARTLGRGLAEFRRASTELRQSLTLPPEEQPAKPAPPQGPADQMAAAPVPEVPAAEAGTAAAEEGAAAAEAGVAAAGAESVPQGTAAATPAPQPASDDDAKKPA
jgi:TatA/E family protein of Tat protein translocase